MLHDHCCGGSKLMAVLWIIHSKIAFANTTMLFVNNGVRVGEILVMVNLELSVEDNFCAKFENNKGDDGGAMSFYENSLITNKHFFKHNLNASAHFIFKNNQANNRGEAIFVEDLDFIGTNSQEYDHYLFPHGPIIGDTLKSKIDLFNNTTKVSGNEVYGGWIDCMPYVELISSLVTFMQFHQIHFKYVCAPISQIHKILQRKRLIFFLDRHFILKQLQSARDMELFHPV